MESPGRKGGLSLPTALSAGQVDLETLPNPEPHSRSQTTQLENQCFHPSEALLGEGGPSGTAHVMRGRQQMHPTPREIARLTHQGIKHLYCSFFFSDRYIFSENKKPRQHFPFSSSEDETDQGNHCYKREAHDLDADGLGWRTHHGPGHGPFLGAAGTKSGQPATPASTITGGWRLTFPQGSWSCGPLTECVCSHTCIFLPPEDALRPLVGSPCPWGSMAFAVNGRLTRARGLCVEEDTVFRP